MNTSCANVPYIGTYDTGEKTAPSKATLGPTGGSAKGSTASQNFKNKKFVLNHILYEMHMYLWTTKELRKLKAGTNHDAIYIAQKTSLRNILNFFNPKISKESDIHFSKFLNEITKEKIFKEDFQTKYFTKADETDYYGDENSIIGMLHKTISHLTDNRFNWTDEKNAPEYKLSTKIDTIFNNVKDAVKEFLKVIKENDGKDIVYKYKTRKPKQIADELKNKQIKYYIEEIEKLL